MSRSSAAFVLFACAGLVLGCKPAEKPLSPVEFEAKNRGECHVLAVSQSRFDPTLAEEPPPRTISETHQQGGDVVGSGAIAKGAVKGAVGGVVVGAIAGDAGKGAAIGAGAGALFGGVRRHRETQRRGAVLALASLLGVAAAAAATAASFDGTRALVCTLDSAAECDTDALCATVTGDEIDLPEAISVDFKASRLRSPNGQRSSPISALEVTETVLIAQGHQNGRGWSMAIDRETGHMTGTIAEPAGAFVLTGSCSASPWRYGLDPWP